MGDEASTLPPEKLRSTCNHCAFSKVRCNKRKPTCQRCETHDFECVYSRSRRRGKPRSSRDQRSIDGSLTPYSAQSSPYNWTNSSLNNVGIDPFSDFTDLLPGDVIFDSSLWADPNNMLYSSNSDSTRNGSSSDTRTINKDTPMVPEQQQPQTVDSSVFMTFAPLDKPCQGETCTSTAFCTLGTLYSMGAAAGRRVPDATSDSMQVSSGLILKTNRITMDRLQTLLKNGCSHCSQQVDLGILFSTAISKMIAWYRAVLDGITDPSTKQSSANRKSVSMTPIMLGDFQLDRTAETRMKAQLLLCELQNVFPLLDLLAERNSRVKTGGEVYPSLDKHLRTSLAELTSEINAMVVSGSKGSMEIVTLTFCPISSNHAVIASGH